MCDKDTILNYRMGTKQQVPAHLYLFPSSLMLHLEATVQKPLDHLLALQYQVV